jgi:predicted Fe-Mo cluster-binding NifX family protein
MSLARPLEELLSLQGAKWLRFCQKVLLCVSKEEKSKRLKIDLSSVTNANTPGWHHTERADLKHAPNVRVSRSIVLKDTAKTTRGDSASGARLETPISAIGKNILYEGNFTQGDHDMKICFPTETLQGMNSAVYGHFGSAPGFVIVDMQNMSVEEIQNGDQHHAHGMCQPLKALGGKAVDAVVVAGIGMGALMKLQSQGIQVYRAAQGTVGQNIGLIQERKLPQFEAKFTCAGHADGGCAHDQKTREIRSGK